MHNAVRQMGRIIGYRCYECRRVVSSMWGTRCNDCSEKERRHQELVQAIKEAKK